jgi:SPP1 gp7 family putative phage head morphogenesis protein
MPSTNEALMDAANRHQVYVQRYGSRVANETVALLNRAEADLVGQIFTRLDRITARGRDRGPATTRRLQELLRQLREINDDIYDEMHGFVRDELRSFAENEAQLAVTRLTEATSAGFGYVAPSQTTLHNIVVSRPFEGRHLRGWFNQLNREQQSGIEQAIRQGLLQSMTNDQIINRIRGTRAANYTDGILHRSRRHVQSVVRTATNFVSNESREETYNNNSDIILAVRWTSTLDGRTSPICRARDGKMAPIGDTTAGEVSAIGQLLDPPGARPPAHINCRSTTTPITRSWAEVQRIKGTDEFEEGFHERLRERGFSEAEIRRIRSDTRASMDGQVPKDVTYQEWLRRQPPEFQDDVLGPTRAQLFRDGDVSLDRFVDESGEQLTLDELKLREAAIWNRIFPDRNG